MRFIGRKHELKVLEKLYLENTFQFVVMYGRRRIGKTRLLSEFCKNKNSILFVAEEYNDKIALEKFSKKFLNIMICWIICLHLNHGKKPSYFLIKKPRILLWY
ncbi:ATP-binding protein [Clostridium tepidiprofundi]|nr:ATP-binding protein [Clostridium tepidiprofundi]